MLSATASGAMRDLVLHARDDRPWPRRRAPAKLGAEACACHFRSGKVLVGKYLVEEALVVQDELVQLDDVLLLKRWLQVCHVLA